MNSWINSIALAVCNPFAFVIGLFLYGYSVFKTLSFDEDRTYARCPDGWPPSPKNDTRIFHPQKKR